MATTIVSSDTSVEAPQRNDHRGNDENRRRHGILYIAYVALGVCALVLALFACLAQWGGLTIAIDVKTVPNLMAPLLLTAGFIERAVEVIISPWRDTDASKKADTVAAIKLTSGVASNETQQAVADFQEYKGKTRQYAFAVSMAFGISAAFVGLRGLSNFVTQDNSSFNAHPSQKLLFNTVDVALSAALLAGGATGIHSVINAFTSFFDATAKQTQQQRNT